MNLGASIAPLHMYQYFRELVLTGFKIPQLSTGLLKLQRIITAYFILMRYNRRGKDANPTIVLQFISLVVKEFEQHGIIVEKYDVVSCKSDTSNSISFGYHSNEIGFGWTNAVFIELLAITQP
ncbi:MAG: trehalase family glycosidase [Nostocaceae cyanobacterium]|nr:trehalase family glycosidase [Nostocaceae cyanobacterium]